MGKRNKCKTWFLTYAQNEASPEDLLEKLKPIDEIEQYLIAQEKHKDGNDHLHAYVKFQDGVVPGEKYANAREVFNLLDKPGNVQTARSCKNVIKHCSKGSRYISNLQCS
jgi:hypothetical protein